MKIVLLGLLLTAFIISCKQPVPSSSSAYVIGRGQMPNLVKAKNNTLHLVYGSGDSVLYASSADNGASFSKPALVAEMPGLYDFAMRGPQIACTNTGVTIIAANQKGDIYSFQKDASGNWAKSARVNDVDTIAKEGLMALGGDGNTLFAVWLDLRGDRHNKIFGASSIDGGKTWGANIVVNANRVCECCKPSVVVRGSAFFVMFRNLVDGNRDLYVIKSADAGKTFAAAEKMGTGNWHLDGCPMDGGGIAIDANNTPQTVWRRQDTIFACAAGKAEAYLGKGRSCTVESINSKNIYAWNEKGDIICLLPGGKKQNLGKGMIPVIKSINDGQAICVWEDDKQIHSAIIVL